MRGSHQLFMTSTTSHPGSRSRSCSTRDNGESSGSVASATRFDARCTMRGPIAQHAEEGIQEAADEVVVRIS